MTIRELVLVSKDDKSQIYLPEICQGCRTCVCILSQKHTCNLFSERNSPKTDRQRHSSKRGKASASSAPSALASVPLGSGGQDQRLPEMDESYQHAGLGTGDSGAHFTFFFNISKSSSSRSYESLTPISIPDWSIPSRSATDWKTD